MVCYSPLQPREAERFLVQVCACLAEFSFDVIPASRRLRVPLAVTAVMRNASMRTPSNVVVSPPSVANVDTASPLRSGVEAFVMQFGGRFAATIRLGKRVAEQFEVKDLSHNCPTLSAPAHLRTASR